MSYIENIRYENVITPCCGGRDYYILIHNNRIKKTLHCNKCDKDVDYLIELYRRHNGRNAR